MADNNKPTVQELQERFMAEHERAMAREIVRCEQNAQDNADMRAHIEAYVTVSQAASEKAASVVEMNNK